MTGDKLLASALRRLERIKRQEAFDPYIPDSKPTDKQLQVFQDFGVIKQQWIRAGNQSGKSATCARIISWVMTGTHPYWTRPAEWADEPLLIVIAGRTGKQLEESLWPKIKSYLEPGTYKEVRLGNILQRVELDNGNRMVFQSLENPTTAQQRLQSYVAHLTWVDELPPTLGIVRELLIRVQARNGYFLASFTPTMVNSEIQQYVDSLQEPEGKVYRFHMLDNPLYSDPIRKEELLARYAHLPEHVRSAIFEGEWLQSEDLVYYFDYSTMVEMPQDYSPLWRHVEVVDPATQSKLGLSVYAEDPQSGIWYQVIADYVSGIYVPTEIIKEVQRRVSNLNVIRRIADPEASWYINQAGAMGIKYTGVHNKNSRKAELIKGLQQALGSRLRLAPHCQNMIQELQNCRWSDKADGKIVNSSKYHLADTAQYFCDNIPKADKKIQAHSWQEWLYKANDARKLNEEKVRTKWERGRIRRSKRSVWS